MTLLACSSGNATIPSSRTLRVDRTLEDKSAVKVPEDEIAADLYKSTAPVDRWSVSLQGTKVTLTPIVPSPVAQGAIEGVEVTSSPKPGERRFELQRGVPAGGRFVVRRDNEAEITIYGSGVPIISSERGTLLDH